MFVLTLALSCVVRAETFSWDASSSLRSLRICRRNTAWHQKQRQEKAHAPSQLYQTHSCAHILTNNVAANMGALIHLGKATDKKRHTGVHRCSERNESPLQGHPHKSYCENPPMSQQVGTQKMKGQRKHCVAAWGLPPTETSPHSVKANTRGRKNH